MLCAACPGPPGTSQDLGVTPDQSTGPSRDLLPPTDQASSDLRLLPDARTTDAATFEVCNLGNDPLPCMSDAICAGNGAFCDSTRKYCVCTTPNCTPGDDQTCNDNGAAMPLLGHCVSSGSCMCLGGSTKDPNTGKCH